MLHIDRGGLLVWILRLILYTNIFNPTVRFRCRVGVGVLSRGGTVFYFLQSRHAGIVNEWQ